MPPYQRLTKILARTDRRAMLETGRQLEEIEIELRGFAIAPQSQMRTSAAARRIILSCIPHNPFDLRCKPSIGVTTESQPD